MSGTATNGLASPAGHLPADTVDLASLGAQVTRPDDEARTPARDRLGTEAGRLADLAGWLAATQQHGAPTSLRRPRCVLIGDPHPTVTPIAEELGVGIRRLEAGGSVPDAIGAGVQAADAEVDGGADLVVLVAPADESDAAPAALVSVLRGLEPVALLPRGVAGLDSAAWARRAAQVRDTRRAAVQFESLPDALLAALGSPELAATAGFLLRASGRRTPLVLDGALALAAALLVYDIAPISADWWQAADTSPDPVHSRACEELGLQPLQALGITSPDGTAGLLAVAVLRAAAAAGR
jgi:NaMN:DMB phosphoribosyltransferase